MIRDYVGNKIKVGDEIIYSVNKVNFRTGKIVKITNKLLFIEEPPTESGYVRTTKRPFESVIKLVRDHG